MNALRKACVVTVCFAFVNVICLHSVSHGQTVVIMAAGGESHSIALKSDGTVWGWGANGSGQAGNGEVGDNQLNPVQVIALTGYLEDITAIAVGTSYWLNQGGHTLARKNDGTVWAWGYGLYGQLGDGAGISRSIPVQMTDASDPSGYLTGIVAVGAGDYHSSIVKSDGTNEARFSPVPVSGLTNVKAVSGGAYHTLALKNDTTVWAWGAMEADSLEMGQSEDIPLKIHLCR